MDEGDWRLQGQERYLEGRSLRFARWWTGKPTWDHDHCVFCWAKFGPSDVESTELTEGYVTADDECHWICLRCFGDFRERFGWTVEVP